MSLLTLLSNQSATQTVVLDRLESTAQIFLPTVIQAGGTQTITLDRLESTAQVFLPTVVQAGGAQTITLNLLGSTAQVFLPAIQLVGAVTDTSDILDYGLKRKRKYKLTKREEEEIAAQLLRERTPQEPVQRKLEINWKQLIQDAVNNAGSIEELNALNLDVSNITSPEATAAVSAEIEKQKDLRRIQLEISAKEGLEEAKRLQLAVLERYQLAQQLAEQEQMKALLEAERAEKEYVEFKRKRDNRIKRIKALMWLAKLDL